MGIRNERREEPNNTGREAALVVLARHLATTAPVRPATLGVLATKPEPVKERATGLHRVAILGNHLPRRCGIATFTADLSDAISTAQPSLQCFVMAMNEAGGSHRYPGRVQFEIAAEELPAYRRAAEYLNTHPVDVVSIQHEYGIFGGPAGSHVLELLRELRVPVVTTLHTILAEPNPAQRQVMDTLSSLSARLVVMSGEGARILQEVHGVPANKIDLIPHGIPEVATRELGRSRLGLDQRPMILTFGLLSPDKGIEQVIDALPQICAEHPDVLYAVVGATHPQVKLNAQESYREMLVERAEALGVSHNLIFYDRFVSKDELHEFLGSADIFITPYLKPEQITSGALAYAVGAGLAVVSTPYVYARELLADDRGVLVPFRDPPAIARAVTGLLGDDLRRQTLRERAFAYGQSMRWPKVARAYLRSFERARAELRRAPRPEARDPELLVLPEINLGHLSTLTDDTGILQHAVFETPRCADGYCLDDNARALLLTSLLEAIDGPEPALVRTLGSRYLAFVGHAFVPQDRAFRNFMSYRREFLEVRGSEDGHGRALWALGTVAARAQDPGRRACADLLFHDALGIVADFSSPRAWAYAVLGASEYLRRCPGDLEVASIGRETAGRLLDLYQRGRRPNWPWFEPQATYCNARLPQALLSAGEWLNDRRMTEAGLESLAWLAKIQTKDQQFAPIGSNGFYSMDGVQAEFDQQPVEAHAMISACLLAGRRTGQPAWIEEAHRAFRWFLGDNQLGRSLYDPRSGGCRDGLHLDRPNENQGAESTLSFLLALTELRLAARGDTHPGVPRVSS